MTALKGYVVIIDADDGRVVRLFKLERKAVEFVTREHCRRWDDGTDSFREGESFEVAGLYFLTLSESRLVDEYSVLEEANGEAEGWHEAERNEIAKLAYR